MSLYSYIFEKKIMISKKLYTFDELVSEFERRTYLLEMGAGKLSKMFNTTPDVIHGVKAVVRGKDVKSPSIGKSFSSIPETTNDLQPYDIEETQDRKTEIYKTDKKIATLEEFIEYFKPDLDVWEIKKWRQNYWAGFIQVKVEYEKRKVDNSNERLWKNLLEEIKYEGNSLFSKNTVKHFKKPLRDGSRNLLELALPDLHLGKLAYADELGQEYNLEIAIETYKTAVRKLLSKIKLESVDKILLIVGNDLFHVDNLQKTTVNNTPQDFSTSYYKMFIEGKKLIISTILELLEIAPVEVLMVPGNHDFTTVFHLGEVLEAFFSGNPNVNIDNNVSPRKYIKHGNVLLGFTHGDNENLNELPLVMAREVPKLWGDTIYREIHTGHFHRAISNKHKEYNEIQSVRVRHLQSLTATDRWHHKKGYSALQSAEAFIWNSETGLDSIYFVNL